MAIGYLIIQARTAHDALPLSGVQIRIMDHQEKIIYELTTDESGETEKISLETLERTLSLDPNFSGTPFISYNVLALANGFNSFRFWKAKRPFSPSNLFRCGNSSAPLP